MCDGIDTNCDGWIDNDWAGDEFEPNDVVGYNLGDIDGTEIEINGAFIHPSIDTDIFKFYVEDRFWDLFNIDVTLTDVPSTMDLTLALWFVEDDEGTLISEQADSADDAGLGGDEEVDVGEGWWPSGQSGWYEVIVSSADSSSCINGYTLIIDANTR